MTTSSLLLLFIPLYYIWDLHSLRTLKLPCFILHCYCFRLMGLGLYCSVLPLFIVIYSLFFFHLLLLLIVLNTCSLTCSFTTYYCGNPITISHISICLSLWRTYFSLVYLAQLEGRTGHAAPDAHDAHGAAHGAAAAHAPAAKHH